MTSIASKFKAVEDLTLEPLPLRPVKGLTMVRVGERTLCARKGDSGPIYTNAVKARCHYVSTDNRLHEVLKGAVKLGALTSEAMRGHVADQEARNKASDNHYSAEQVLRGAKALGIRLTAAQTKTVMAAKLPHREFRLKD